MTQPTAPTHDFSATLQLPRTDFPMRANLPAREPAWVQRWLDEDVYGQLRAKRAKDNAPVKVVHLGPPYANGHFHMGHVLTYVLKDFMVRSQFMAGRDAPYVPGWDCHGLPIEWKIEQELRAKGQTKHDVSVLELRARCRAYAEQWIAVQKAEWQRFGALGDWARPYKTMDAANEAGIVACLGQMVQRGLVSQQLRSTQWSWAEETALAEAEVEYKDVTSTAVWVALPLVGRANQFLVVWTTTPWTLPANRAVAVREGEEYCLAEIQFCITEPKFNGMRVWVAENCAENLALALKCQLNYYDKTGTIPVLSKGKDLIGLTYHHPLYPAQTGQVFHGEHVTTDSGTGLVHIAPAHGQEDFVLGKAHGLDLACPVDGAGKYEPSVPPLPRTGEALAGKLIWPAQKLILAELAATGLLLHQQDFQHSYPVSWRSKEKLIFRSTPQWFVSMDQPIAALGDQTLRARSLELIHGHRPDGTRNVVWTPEHGENRIGGMIANRPDWCISRQRAWGVPMTIMVDKTTGEVVADDAVWTHIVALVAAEGIDAWDSRLGGREAELFPAGWLAKQEKTPADFTFVRDILDVWFDSGTTWRHVVQAESGAGQRFDRRGDGKRPADVYQEGSDQHRGWFHSSLLTSVALTGDAPYEQVITSGFVVDGEGRKFSKSLGNGVEPKDLLPKYGMDIIRLWVASADYSEDIRYSPTTMDAMAEHYRRFRNTFRWLLGNLHGFDAATHAVPHADLPELEQFVLHTLHSVLTEVREAFEQYQFHKATRALLEFCGSTLSNLYFEARKDVLYCNAAQPGGRPDYYAERRAVQTVVHHLLHALTTHLAPLLPFTTDEVWRTLYGEAACVHLEVFSAVPDEWRKGTDFEKRWEHVLRVRNEVNVAIERVRNEGVLGSNLDISEISSVRLEVTKMFVDQTDENLLRLVCGVSGFSLKNVESDKHETSGISLWRPEIKMGQKCPRCWRYYGKLEASGVCLRCEDALSVQGAV